MAAVGSIASIFTHICALLNLNIFDKVSDIFSVCLVIIWIIVIMILASHAKEYDPNMKININNFFGLDNYFYKCPSWMKYFAIGLGPYVLLMIVLSTWLNNKTLEGSAFFLIFYVYSFCILYSYLKD
jgi:hypothetical protein